MTSEVQEKTRLAARELRWQCSKECFDFETTADLDPSGHVVGQSTALEALEFAILSRARGQNVYVRGPRGTGRRTMVTRLLQELRDQVIDPAPLHDHCYVHNFHQPDRPRLIRLNSGEGPLFRRRMREVARFVDEDLHNMLDAEAYLAERRAVERAVREQVEALTGPLEKELRSVGLELVQVQQGQATRSAIFPLVEGKPVPPPELERATAAGEVPPDVLAKFKEQLPAYQQKVEDTTVKVVKVQQEGIEKIQAQIEGAARDFVREQVARIRADYDQPAMKIFLDEVIADVVENRVRPSGPLPAAADRYGVNVVREAPLDGLPPVSIELAPNLTTLLGTVELAWDGDGPAPPDHAGIRAGSLLHADSGFLILDAYDLLSEPGAWRALMRTLRSGMLEIVPPELAWFRTRGLVSPEPIPIDVRVILIGDANIYYLLDRADPDFEELFKVLADFDREIDRDQDGMRNYAEVIAQLARTEKLLPFRRDAVEALAEHGARIAAHQGKLTARFGRLGDLAREAAFLARREEGELVTGEHVVRAVRRTKKRASLPQRKFQEMIARRVIRIETEGSVVGQVNGLAVIQAGPITYGFPARITATIGVGRSGLIDIEASASLSGSIHTKGFHILGGLLRHLLQSSHPLAFSASLAFEQSYGGIDGDSASGAEICCLLSALTDIPMRQGLAMTGAIDQHGHIQAIGGVNEKIEGFYDTCNRFGLTGDQGVIIPSANAGDLMLRADVVEAADRGEFHVYSVERIEDALELFTGMPAGEWDEEAKCYPEGSLLRLAVDRSREFWELAAQSPHKDKEVRDERPDERAKPQPVEQVEDGEAAEPLPET